VTVSIKDRLQKLAAEDPYQFPKGWIVPGGASKASVRRRNELSMWRTWKEQGEKPEHMGPLLESLQPMIKRQAGKYVAARQVHRPALEARANSIAISALRKYDPTRAQINTHLYRELRGLQRYTIKHQNVSRITEDHARRIGDLQRAQHNLYESLGREPTTLEISDKMKMSPRVVSRIQKEMRPDLIASVEEDPFSEEIPIHREVMMLIPYELTRQELLVWEYWYGYGGKPKISKTGLIAKKLGWSDSKVSQTKRAIAEKIKEHL